MKPVIPIAAAFVIGLAGSTALGMRRPATLPDSTVKAAAPAAAPIRPALQDSVASTPDSTAAPRPADTTGAPADTTHPVDSAGVAAQRLALVFSKLSPQDILPIAERMSDSALAPVLISMGTRRAAPILAALPPARAKVLSRRMLAPTAGTSP